MAFGHVEMCKYQPKADMVFILGVICNIWLKLEKGVQTKYQPKADMLVCGSLMQGYALPMLMALFRAMQGRSGPRS